MKNLLLPIAFLLLCTPLRCEIASAVVPSQIAQPSGATAQATSVGLCNSEFVLSLDVSKVKIFQTVQKQGPFTQCTAEWTEHGTCCDGPSLVSAFKEEKAGIEQAITQIVQLAQDIIRDADNVKTNISKNSVTFNNGATQKVLSADTLKENALSSLSQILGSTNYQTIRKESETCWNKTMEMRGSALCSVCSGRLSQFSTATKLFVDINECETAITSCKGFYGSIEIFINQFETMIDIISRINNFIPQNLLPEFNQLKSKILMFVPSADLLTRMRNYNYQPNTGLTKERFFDSNAICGQILSLRKPTFIQDMQAVLKAKKEILNFISNARPNRALKYLKPTSFFLLMVERSPLTSNWRFLAFNQGNFNPFSADTQVYLAKQDNMFGAFDGAKGTTLDYQFSNAKPVNLAQRFP